MIKLNHTLKYLMTFVILVSFSCKDKLHDETLKGQQKLRDSISKTPEGIISKIEIDKFEVIVFDGCQYIIYKEQPSNNKAIGFMAHKGNCNNPFHFKTK